ncbi:rhomboid protease GluP [Mucilaginibacter frigoritolerans]|jgi:rhomboid protease GluP|uniref:Rhomboid protease GluP n=1 Tax=Mucilaginibacter frigoritolerans TaxID=652788 RepID=A0A562U261_9SPHI|nr:rhomboid family intramembrane serine protease [Mucilaginibacter frigoritolerans]TWI99889.1 rhomboid protease GluP [Mucilaginibacter frigoritolerans]
MAGGISPNKIITIPLEDYNSDHYLTLLYQAMLNMGWDIGYFDHDGIIAYTKISWESYSEEISARLKDNIIVIKSECVGYQGLFTDYGKNNKNLELLLGEISYAEFHLQQNLEQTTQELINGIPEKQFLNLEDPPMAGKEQLRGFFSPIIPRKKYVITPLLVIVNTIVFILTSVAFVLLPKLLFKNNISDDTSEKIYMLLGFNSRTHVLNGEIWRLLTSVFLHFSWLHLVLNMIVLVYVGSLIEYKLGKWNFLLMFLFTGIISSMFSVMWHFTEISAGASGAIFGLFGILLALLSTNFYERSARKALLISTAITVGINIIPVGEGIDHAAHFGGLISGYILGWIAYWGVTQKNLFIKKWGIALSGLLLTAAFVAYGVLFMPQYQVKEYEALIQKYETMSNQLNVDFYGETSERQVKLDSMEQRGLPRVTEIKKIAAQLTHLKLPYKKKKDAEVQAKLINLYCQYYNLLYLEFKEQNHYKYRPKIDHITDQINEVRSDYSKNN